MASAIRLPRRGPARWLRNIGSRGFRVAFELAQRLGLDVLPHHFYSNVPDIAHLRTSRRWRAASTMVGVSAASLDAQLATLGAWVDGGVPDAIWDAACREHGEPGYGPIESDALYAFVRSRRPRRIVQVGAGVSTAIVLRASQDVGYAPEVACVDPFPTEYLLGQAAAGRIALIRKPAQEVALEALLVEPDCLLFVDSTHTVKAGSEVNRIVLEVLPALPAGAWVHFHDVTFPYDYGRRLLDDELFFWNESTLLHAFLIGNDRYRLELSMSMLHYGRPTALRALLPHYRPQTSDHGLRLSLDGDFPSSAYLRVLA